ncbi:MAG: PepSY domain-containing protein [Bacteroidetes bacterium]|nr:PepSY domain-containing protein [Bacteroidota bacterium]
MKSSKQNIFGKIYKWHKYIGLITVIPVIFWTLSGFMHPFLSHWFKPIIPKEFIAPVLVKKEHLQLPLHKALEANHIHAFKSVRIIQFKDSSFYQVKKTNASLIYLNTYSGKILENGDKKYAEWMARYFLGDSISPVHSIEEVDRFTQQYKFINRLLPVWKITFHRPDAMDVYVETASTRLGTFNPTYRKVFLWIFDNFHNWNFLQTISNNSLRIIIMITLLSIIIISSLSGIIIYGFLWNKFQKPDVNDKPGLLRKYHRQVGIAVAFVSFTFAFSGAYHATQKWEPDLLPELVYEPIIKTSEVSHSFLNFPIEWDRLVNISIVKPENGLFYQTFYLPKMKDNTEMSCHAPSLPKEEKKEASWNAKPAPEVIYFNLKDTSIWQNGDIKYAQFVASFLTDKFKLFKDKNPTKAPIFETGKLHKFESREYGFAFKRLPVVKLAYETPEKTSYFIETATSRIAAKIENADRLEGYSFAIFHKYLLMDWAGKNVRDITMMFSAMGLLAISLLGLALFIKKP